MQVKKQLWVLLFFFILTIVLYRDGYGSQFLDDFFTLFVYFKIQRWQGFLDSFGFTSIYYGHNLFSIGFYEAFGMNRLAWFLLFTGFHSLNAFLGFVFFNRLLKNNRIGNAGWIAFLGSLLFLTAPYQTENVIWAATLHYALSFFYFWSCMLLYDSHMETGKRWQLVLFHSLFSLSLITHEISLVFPGVFVLVFALLRNPAFEWTHLKEAVFKIALPHTFIIAAYFLITRLMKGHFIGHYGSDVHLANFTTPDLASAFMRYLIKLTCYTHYLPYHDRTSVYEFFTHSWLAVLFFFSLLVAGVLLMRSGKRKSFLIIGFLMCAFVLLIPVLNMYFAYLLKTENGRLSYFASFFTCMAVALLFSYPGKHLAGILCLILVGLNIYFLQPLVAEWKGAARVQSVAVSTFKWENAGRIFFLNQPCYFRDVYVFRNKNRFYRAMYMLRDIDISNKIHEVAWTTVNDYNDSVTVEKTDSNTLKVALSGFGRWFWYNGYGATDYEDEFCKTDFDDYSLSYTVKFKDLSPSDAVIYFTPDGWREVNFKSGN